MISALRRKLGGEKDGQTASSPIATMPAGVHRVDQELQRKFAKGVQYNSELAVAENTDFTELYLNFIFKIVFFCLNIKKTSRLRLLGGPV